MNSTNEHRINLLIHYMSCDKNQEWKLVQRWLIEKIKDITRSIEICVQSEACEDIEKHYGDLYMFKKIHNELVTKPEYE